MGVINYTTAKINELLDKIDKAPETIENGKTPVFVTGTTTTLDPGLSATAEVIQDGVDENGNPKYKINFGVPKGLDGASGGGGGTADSVQWSKVLNKPSWVNSATKPTYTASEVGALPADTTIPSKTSQLTNDSNFLTSSDFKTINGQPIVGAGNIQIEGGSSGETGNVNVTNASDLKSSEYYTFKPASDGSVGGKFLTIPSSDDTRSGLMPSTSFSKLKSIKPCLYLPITFEQINSSTTKEEIIQIFGQTIPEVNNISSLFTTLSAFCILSNSDGSGESGVKFFIGNNDSLFRGLYTEEDGKLLSEFTYMSLGGILKTTSISMSKGLDEEYSLSINVENHQDGDTYVVSSSLLDLDEDSSVDEFIESWGGEDKIKEFFDEVILKGSRACIISTTSSTQAGISYNIPLSVRSTAFIVTNIFISITYTDVRERVITKYISFSYSYGSKISSIKISNIYSQGYEIDSGINSINTGSTSDDISNILGGISGIQSLEKALESGNNIYTKFVYEGTTYSTSRIPLLVAVIKTSTEDNAPRLISISGVQGTGFGALFGVKHLLISYEEGVFTCSMSMSNDIS